MIARIGKYSIERELGHGGFGDVFLAFDPDVGQKVAIKHMRVELGSDPEMLKRFQYEIRTTASLRHKNIVTILASGVENGSPYLVMEYLEGQTLKQIIQVRKPLTVLEKVGIMTQVVEGLAYAHSKGIVHRDVKPENIMLLPDDSVKIMDFGIALAADRNTVMTATGGLIGTPNYFAPEQLQGQKANEQSDIFSLGDVYYELLSGQHPFERFKHDWKSLQIAIVSFDPPGVSQLAPDCPEALELLVHRMLAKEPEFRYASFEELLLDSRAILVDLQRESAAALLRAVPALVEAGDLHGALAKLREAQQLDPGNREVRQLRDAITQQIQRVHARARVAELLAEAEALQGERRYGEAVQSLESAARLDASNATVQARLSEARARFDGSVRAGRLVSEARFKQQKGHLTDALERLTAALAIDPDHTEARALYPRVSELVERRQRESRLQQAIQTASDHLSAGRFTEALAALVPIGEEQPGAPEIAQLRAHIEQTWAENERRLRVEKLNLAITRTHEAIQAGELDRAGEMVDYLFVNFSGEPGAADALLALRQHLHTQIRARQIAIWEVEARGLLQKQSYREALDMLSGAIREFPGDAGLERLRQSAVQAEAERERERLRQAEIAEVASRVREMLSRNEIRQAVSTLAATRSKYPRESVWATLESEITERQAELAAREAAAKRQIEAAAKRQAEIEAQKAAAKRQAELEAQQAAAKRQAEIEAQQAAAKRRAEIEAQQAAAKRQAEIEAQQAAAKRRAEIEAQQAAAKRQAELEAQQAAAKRQAEISAAADRVRGQLNRSETRQAVSTLVAARSNYPGETVWATLESEIAERQAELEARQAAAKRQAEFEAQKAAAKRQAESEAQQAAAKRQAEIEAQKAAAKRQAELEAQQAAAKRQVEIEAQRAAAKRQSEISAAVDRVRGQLSRSEIRQAVSTLAAARSNYPGEAVWATLESEIAECQAELEAQQAAAKRQAEIEAQQAAAKRQAEIEAQQAAAKRQAEFEAQQAAAKRQAELEVQQTAAKRQAELEAQQAAAKRQAEIEAQKAAAKRQAELEAQQAAAKRQAEFESQQAAAKRQAELEAQQAAPKRQAEIAAPPAAKKPLPWKPVAAVVAAAAAIVAGLVVVPRWLHKDAIVAIPVEIRTDPQGASVKVGDRVCVTPNCRFDLPPGQYHVEAQLKDYVAAEKIVVVDGATRLVDLTLQPVPPVISSTAATGKLLVRAGLPGALVTVDGKALGRTDATGILNLVLEAKTADVRVEKDRFQPAIRQVTVVRDGSQEIEFTLRPKDARLALAGAPAGVEVRVGNQLLGRTDGSPDFLFREAVTPGRQTLQVTGAGASRQISQEFQPDETVHLDWKTFAPTKETPKETTPPAKTVTPPSPTEEETESRDWDRVRSATDLAALRTFVATHPKGAHRPEALTRIESLAWAQTNKDSADALQAFLKEFGGSPHAPEASSRLADLVWKGVDQSKEDSLKKFADENPGNPHVADARKLLDAFEKQRQGAEADRLKQLDAKKQQDTQKQQIRAALERFNDAFRRGQKSTLQAVWPGNTSKPFVDAMALSIIELRPDGDPVIAGDQATVVCTETATVKQSKKSAQSTLKVTLQNRGADWIITGIGPANR